MKPFGRIKVPDNVPVWLTSEYLDQCLKNSTLQENWKPKVGDWYFCRDPYQILQITDLDQYYSEGKIPPLKDVGKDTRGHWCCDVYLPDPSLAISGRQKMGIGEFFKVLLVEDDPAYREIIISDLKGKPLVILEAESIEKAEKLFAENPDVAAILMDACVPGNHPTTLPLVEKIRETFQGPIIAISSKREYRQELKEVGASHSCDKYTAAHKLTEILGL